MGKTQRSPYRQHYYNAAYREQDLLVVNRIYLARNCESFLEARNLPSDWGDASSTMTWIEKFCYWARYESEAAKRGLVDPVALCG